MKVLIGIGHPAHVHFYKHTIKELKEAGDEVLVITKRRRMAIKLLECYDINYEIAGTSRIQGNSIPRMIASFASFEFDMLRWVREYQPDVVTGIGNIPLAHASSIFDPASVIFDDSDPPTFANRFAIPFSDVICTPIGYTSDLGSNHIRYKGYHELAYLHPDRFEPNSDGLRENGINPEETYFVLRFIGWNALHDVNRSGLSRKTKRELISLLEDHGVVYITAEEDLPTEFRDFQTQIPPNLMHDLLYHADMYIGDSQTMATEAAILGTPSVRSNSFAGEGDMSNFIELEEEYGLLYSTPEEEEAVRTVEDWLENDTLQVEYEERLQELLTSKIDVTSFIKEQLIQAGQ